MNTLLEQAIAKHQAGDLPEAYRLYLESVRVDATLHESWINLGDALAAAKKFDLAESCFQKALHLQDDPRIHHRLGEVLRENLKYSDAEMHLLKAVAVFPHDARVWYNLALLYMATNQMDKAATASEKSADLEKHLPDIILQRALIHLFQEEFHEGFIKYDSRLETKDGKLPMSEPPWNGEALNGKTLHVYSEQGFGDVIQFIRYLPNLPKDGPIFVTVPLELRKLIEPSFPLANIQYFNHGIAAPKADYSISLGSLPKFYLKNKPSGDPYLITPKNAPKIQRPKGIKKAVGISWSGNPKHQYDKLRSSTADAFIKALALPGVELYSFQFHASYDSALVGPMGLAQDLTPLIKDFADTAGLVSQLDCVVSVDTSIVHLCGALGIPCHVLIPYGAVDWRWQHERTDSPWYSSLTLHRQGAGESWDDVLKRVADLIVSN